MFKFLRLFIIINVIGGSITTFAQSNPPIPAPVKSGQIEQNQTEQIKPRPEDKIVSSQTGRRQEKSTQEKPTTKDNNNDSTAIWRKLDPNWTTAAATVVLAFFAIVQVRVYWKQAKLMEKGLKETQRANDTAKSAADTARDTVAAMERNAEKQLRAYLHISILPLAGFDETKPATARARITNYGQTPAYKMRCKLDVIARHEPIGTDFALPNIRNDWVNTTSDVFPNTSVKSSRRRTVPQEAPEKFTAGEISGIRNRQLTIYVIAEALYVDAFGQNRRTSACAGISTSTDELKKLTSNWPDIDPKKQVIMLASVDNSST